MNNHQLAPPLLASSAGDVSGKVQSTLITTNQADINPKSSLGFATYRVCANILAHRATHVQPVRQYIGASHCKC